MTGLSKRSAPASVRGIACCRLYLALLSSAALYCSSVVAAYAYVEINPPPIYNFYGQVGLFDMPTARFAPDGEVAATFSKNAAFTRYNLDFEALPWLEATFRYTMDPRGFQLDDRSLGFKIHLSEEGQTWPSIAVGAQDVLGTGYLAAEYLVASKHIGDFDVTAGFGWNRFSGVAQFGNPFGAIFPSFKSSKGGPSTGGVPLAGTLFHGPKTGIFGGISWQTPIRGLQLIAELSGDNRSGNIPYSYPHINSHINLGFSYEPWKGLQFSGGYFYGSQFGFRVTYHFNAFDDLNPERIGAAPIPLHTRTPEDRNAAELDMLQAYTHFYDNWPNKQLSHQAKEGRTPDSSLAEAIYAKGSRSGPSIADAETFGHSLILETKTGHDAISCGHEHKIQSDAAALGFQQVVYFDPADSRNIKICSITAPQSPDIPIKMFVSDRLDKASASDGIEFRKTRIQNDSGENANAQVQLAEHDTDKLKTTITTDAAAQGVAILGIAISADQISVAFVNGRYRTEDQAIGRLLRVLMADAPQNIERFRLITLTENVPNRELQFNRSDIERLDLLSGDARGLLPVTPIKPAPIDDPQLPLEAIGSYPSYSFFVDPGYQQSLFDPDNPYRFGIYAAITGAVQIDPHLSLTGTFDVNIYNTLDKITRVSNSALPHVRSDFASYLKKGKNGIAGLNAQYYGRIAPNTYYLARAGYLESMYAGIGGEVLWRPEGSRFALGASLYAVQQRNFNRLFGFRHYHVLTGHVAVYYNSPFYDLNFEVHAGRYLAGDYGATFVVTRRFDSGVEIGAYMTLTNVPFSKFGEGSFDKGFIVRIPVDFLVPLNTSRVLNMDFSPLTRDGGQRLDGEESLYRMTQPDSENELRRNWSKVMQP